MASPAEWGLRFQELSADASRMYGRVLRRYDELLDRVARGEIPPGEVQKQFRDYLQEQATSSTRELVETSVALLAGLLYAEAKYREAMLEGLLPSDGPIPPPPSPSSFDLTNWFQALSTYAAEQSARGMKRYQMLAERIAAGDISAPQVQEHGRRYLERHAPAFVNDVMDLGLSFVGRLQRSSTSFAEGLYDRVLGTEDEDIAPPEPPLCVDLRAESGSVATATIVVESSRLEPADVVCRASDFAPRGGGAPFHAALDVNPPRFTLAAREQRDVTLRLPLAPSLFVPGRDYVALLRISGAGENEKIVQLLARADPIQRNEPASTPPRKKQRK